MMNDINDVDLIQKLLDDVFFTFKNSGNTIPDQKFKKAYSNILLTTGGHLVDDERQYFELMKLFRLIGEKKLYIVEDFGLLENDNRQVGFRTEVSTSSNLNDLEINFAKYDPYGMAMIRNSYFVFGESKRWAIYLAEYPTILLIGCEDEHKEEFKRIFHISSNGYQEIRDFIALEFRNDYKKIKIFEENYVGKCT